MTRPESSVTCSVKSRPACSRDQSWALVALPAMGEREAGRIVREAMVASGNLVEAKS